MTVGWTFAKNENPDVVVHFKSGEGSMKNPTVRASYQSEEVLNGP